jgi:hypothetical protein
MLNLVAGRLPPARFGSTGGVESKALHKNLNPALVAPDCPAGTAGIETSLAA